MVVWTRLAVYVEIILRLNTDHIKVSVYDQTCPLNQRSMPWIPSHSKCVVLWNWFQIGCVLFCHEFKLGSYIRGFSWKSSCDIYQESYSIKSITAFSETFKVHGALNYLVCLFLEYEFLKTFTLCIKQIVPCCLYVSSIDQTQLTSIFVMVFLNLHV